MRRLLKNPGRFLIPLVLALFFTAPALAQHEHQHPVKNPPESEVRLDEKLGEYIPLELQFTDEQGQKVSLKELLRVPTLIVPIYYACPNVCSFLQGGLAQSLKEVKLAPGESYQILSVSFDETETPADAAKARTNYLGIVGSGFPPKAWRFLTGDETAIRALTGSAGYYFKRQGKDFLHPVAVFAVTTDGKIVRYLHGTRFLSKDLTLALVEASEGRVGATIRRMAQFCFSYDPQNRTYVFNLLRVTATVVILTLGSFFLYLVLGSKKKN